MSWKFNPFTANLDKYNDAAAHDAVTLDANADTLLSLSTQELGLDTQVANKIFGGPVSGGDAVPTFRSLVAADIEGIIDHGALAGLSDDDHTQYALLVGRSAGQTLIGGTTTTADLTLQTTSGIGTTGADMHFLTGNAGATEAMTILNDGKVGIGTVAPAYELDVVGSIQTNATFRGDTWVSATNNSMNIQPTGDTDDFFSFKTPADRPTIKREGGKYIYVESSNVNDVGISFRKDADHSGTVNYYKDTNEFGLTSKDPIVFKACEDYDSYIKICAADNIPELTVVGSSGFKINAGGTNSLLLNDSGGNVGIGQATPTAYLHLKAGTATASTAPIKLTSGTLNTTPEAGTIEFLTDAFYATITTGPTRKTFAFTDSNITGSAATLTTPRTINGVSFDGSANITVTAAADTLTGTELKSTVITSSLTIVGTIATGVWEGTDVAVAHGGTGKSSWTQYLIPYADTTISFSQIAIGTADQVLTSNGVGAAPTFQDAAGGAGDVGGLYGINVETLSADKTLTVDSNKIYQYLDEGGANRIITLATAGASAGDRFVIRHNGSYDDDDSLQIRQSLTVLDSVYAGAIKEFIFDGTNWISGETGAGENDNKTRNISIGLNAEGYFQGIAIGSTSDGHSYGVAIGYNTSSYSSGVAIGDTAKANFYGIAIGRNADGVSYGVALGYGTDTNSKRYSVALGYESETERYSEIAHCIDGSSTQDYNMSSAGWAIQTANATPVEMFLGETANQRFTINPESVVSFVIRITARDNVANEVASYKIEGLIKRDGAGNTVLVWSNKTVQYEDDASWDVAVTADDTNEALIITVTGDATNPVRWAGRIDEVETQF